MLRASVTDAPEQTAAVLRQIARGEEEGAEFEQWQALQTWLEGAERRVIIPYAEELAAAIPPVAVRLRRDFGALLSLVEAHALLHQATRRRDGQGRIVAELSDYAAVRAIVADLIAEGAEASVSPTVRETVQAVESLTVGLLPDGERPGVSLSEVAEQLGIDKSAVSRGVRMATAKGYLRNLEGRRGRAGRYVPEGPLPGEATLLPEPGVLQCGTDWGGHSDPPAPWTHGASPNHEKKGWPGMTHTGFPTIRTRVVGFTEEEWHRIRPAAASLVALGGDAATLILPGRPELYRLDDKRDHYELRLSSEQ